MDADGPGVVIVGAGECGTRAALVLRERGFLGSVTLIGAEPHHPYERPPLSKGLGTGHAALVIKEVASRDSLSAARITLLAPADVHRIERDARTVVLGDGRRLAYDKLLLTTGARPRRLPAAEGVSRCVALRTFDDAVAIRSHMRAGSRLVVIGGGFIGLELAASGREAGATVTVIEAQARILARGVPADIAAMIHERHVHHGVHILCGQSIDSIADAPDGGVLLRLGGGPVIEADLAVIGVGALPNTALAEAAGLPLHDGIVVDDRLRTADPLIWAAGDCCSFPLALYGGRRVRLEAWRNAQEQGTLAALNMLGHDMPHEAVPWFWSDQYDLGLQVAGLVDEGATTVARRLGSDGLLLFHLAPDGRLVAASGIGQGNSIARDIRLAEMLIARRAAPSQQSLASPEVKLKSLLPLEPGRRAVA